MNYRNPKILKAAKDSPYCFGCMKHNDGTVVGAHSNQLCDGKGMAIKAHDYRIAFLCYICHVMVDEGSMSKQEKIDYWEAAHRRTIGYLFEAGIVS